MARARVAIIGGGVIGLSIGWRLAVAGVAVTIIERAEAGHGATWAAAGMLAAGSEVEPGEADLFPLLARSQAMWPDFAAAIGEAGGVEVGLRSEGTLSVALTPDDAGRLRRTHALQLRMGVSSRWLGRAEALELEPRLNPRLTGAVLVPGDHQVDNRLLAEALKRCFARAGGQLHEHAGTAAIRTAAGRVTGVETSDGWHAADSVILAAGAWSTLVPGLPTEASPPVRPVKGQMLALAMDPADPLLRHVLWTQKAYLVPRADGRLIVGATTEERGFDPALTAGGMLSLLESAWRALPSIEDLPIVETWAGFRPGSRDDAPILGKTCVEGLILATGHHRNGILLAPITAETIAALVLTGVTDPIIAGFGLDRFGAAPMAGSSIERTREWISA
jgi:glycine oxidase